MTSVSGIAVLLYLLATLPPRAILLAGARAPNVVYGAYHIHTSQSDGVASPDEVAAAAARAGLQFVILTDHGYATNPLRPPEYRSGVLVIDAVEITTDQGHIVALGLTQPSSYPLRGNANGVIEDIHRLGGWAVVAHPDSPKPALQWTAWKSSREPYDGIEWLNGDTVWRERSIVEWTGAFARNLLRGPESLANLFVRPDKTLDRWDELTRVRNVVGLAAADVHGVRGWGGAYEQIFRAFSQAVVMNRPLTHDPIVDARAVLAALKQGNTYSVITAWGAPGTIEFSADDGGSIAHMGDHMTWTGHTVTMRARVSAPNATVALFHDGKRVSNGRGELSWTGFPEVGSYRIEAYLDSGLRPWLVTNPIYWDRPVIQGQQTDHRNSGANLNNAVMRLSPDDPSIWSTEHYPPSTVAQTVENHEVRLDYKLAETNEPVGVDLIGQFKGQIEPYDRVSFVARADRPMRISVRAMMHEGRPGVQWGNSVYVDTTPRRITILVDDFEPMYSAPDDFHPYTQRIDMLLWVIDTANTEAGVSGTLWLSDVTLNMGPNLRTY